MEYSEPIKNSEKNQLTKFSTIVGVVVNFGLTIVQIGAGIVFHSSGLIADGIHTMSDLVADFAVLFAKSKSAKAADEIHPYGYHRYENAASLFLGILLLAVAASILFSAIQKIVSMENVRAPETIAIYFVLLSLFAKEVLFRYLIRVAKKVRSSLLIANAWHARSDAASSLVVLVGVVGSLLGYPLLDSISALVVGLIILKMGWKFTSNSLFDLMDKSADQNLMDSIRSTIMETPGILGLHDLKSRKMADLFLIDVHIEVEGQKTIQEGHDLALMARNAVLDKYPVLNVMIHIDPI
jgi:cation diffusion facilitator family transporter